MRPAAGELGEDQFAFFGPDARTVVFDEDLVASVQNPAVHLHPGFFARVVLDRVGDQVDEHLAESIGVGVYTGARDAFAVEQPHPGLGGQSVADAQRTRQGRFRVDALGHPRRFTAFKQAQIERAVEQTGQAHTLLMDDGKEMPCLRRVQIRRVEQDLGKGTDRRHRRAHFVADLAQEIVLLGIELLQALVGLAQLASGNLQFVRLAFQTFAVFADALRFVGNAHEFVQADRFTGDHLRDHRPRRGGADAAGQFAFEL